MTAIVPITTPIPHDPVKVNYLKNVIAYNNFSRLPDGSYSSFFINPMLMPGFERGEQQQRADYCNNVCKGSNCYKNITYVTAGIAALLIIPGAALRATGSTSAGATLLTIGGLVGAVALSTFAAFCIKKCQRT